MVKKSFSIYEFLVYGIRTMLENIRLFVLTGLSILGLIFASFGVSALIALPITQKLWLLMLPFKDQFAHAITAQEHMAVANELGKKILDIIIVHPFLMGLSLLFLFIFLFGIFTGFIRIILDICEKGKSSVNRLFSSFDVLPKLFFATMIFFLIVGIGFVFLILPGLFMLLRFRFFFFFIIDKNVGAIESLKLSFRATRGLEWDVLGLTILCFVLGKFSFFIGFPAAQLMMAAAYLKLPGNKPESI